MRTASSTYCVTYEYIYKKKPEFHALVDFFTLPVRLMVGGERVEIKEREVVLLPYLADHPLARFAQRITAFVFCAYFYGLAVKMGGALLVKHYFEAHLIRYYLDNSHNQG